MHLRLVAYLILFFWCPQLVFAQFPIGTWQDHLPYQNAIGIASLKNKVIAATPYSLFSVDLQDKNITRLSKINGLTEVGISTIATDSVSQNTIVAYTTSNIDIITPTGLVNIDEIKNKNIAADKRIFQIYCYQEKVYLATAFGIVVIDLEKKEIKESYIIGTNGKNIKVSAVAITDSFFYAATEEGLKRASSRNANLSDYHNWVLIETPSASNEIDQVAVFANGIVIRQGDSLYAYADNTWKLFYKSNWNITNIEISSSKLISSERSSGEQARIIVLMQNGSEFERYQHQLIKYPLHAFYLGSQMWIADSISGLLESSSGGFINYQPNSPYSIATGEVAVSPNQIVVASGMPQGNINNRNGFYRYSDQSWSNYNFSNVSALDSINNIVSVAVSNKDGSIWLGSFGGGLLQFKPNNQVVVYKQGSGINASIYDPTQFNVAGLAFDKDDNLWISNYGASKPIVVLKADGTWRNFIPPFSISNNAVSQILIDDLNQKWIIAPDGNGLFCFNHGISIDNPGDDNWKYFRTGNGNGNLPDNNVLSLAQDKSGFIWVGTSKGIGIIQCADLIFTTQACEAILPVVQVDNFAGYLFRDEQVQAIAVDAADRKWIGTKNGAWLISADGQKTILRFTETNSSLLSNNIKRIAIDQKSGVVYFATDKGMCSYYGAAIEGSEKAQSIIIFPNPVPPTFNGPIAIRGLVNNAIVKITELDGRLVFQTTALGGQAIWNGTDYRGRKISTGIYLVVTSDETRKQKRVGKIVFISK